MHGRLDALGVSTRDVSYGVNARRASLEHDLDAATCREHE